MKDYSKCRKVSSDRYDKQRLPIREACNCEECLGSLYTDPNVQGKHAPKNLERNGCDCEKAINPLKRKFSPKEAKVKFISTEEAISLAKSGTCERPRVYTRSSSNRKQKSLRAIYSHVATECSDVTIANQQASSPAKYPSILNKETTASTSSKASKSLLLPNWQLSDKTEDERRLPTNIQTESCVTPMPLILVIDPKLPNGPVNEACWKGIFDVFPTNSQVGVQAQFSSKLSYKAYDIKNHMPEILKLDMICSKDVWPKIFQQDLPTAYDVALYFFPCESSERYISLVEHINSGHFALKACITDVELLIFTSERLFEGSKNWLLSDSPVKSYLWGIFHHKHKSHNCYKQAQPLISKSKNVNDLEETNVKYGLSPASNRSQNASYEDVCHLKVQKVNEKTIAATLPGMVDDLNQSRNFEKPLQVSYENKSLSEPQKIKESALPAVPPGFLLMESRLPQRSSQFLSSYNCKNIPKESGIPATPPGFLIAEAHKKNLPAPLLQDKLIKDDMIEKKDIKSIGVILGNKNCLKSQSSGHLDVSTSSLGFLTTNTYIKNQKNTAIPASPPGFLSICGTSKDGNSRESSLSKKAAIMTGYEAGHHKYTLTSSKAQSSQQNLQGCSRIEVKKESDDQMK